MFRNSNILELLEYEDIIVLNIYEIQRKSMVHVISKSIYYVVQIDIILPVKYFYKVLTVK